MEASSWLLEARTMKWKVGRHRGGSGDKRVGSEEAASEPSEAHLAVNVCATQWLRGGWPPWGGWLPQALWRAAGAIFAG